MRSVLGAMLLACAAPSPASAQRVTGPFAGLFGGGSGGAHTQSLDFRGGLGAGYETTRILNGEDFDPSGTPRTTGLTDGGTGALSYDRRGDRVHFLLDGTTTIRTYPGPRRVVGAGYALDTTMDARLGRKFVVNLDGGAAFAPFFQLRPLFAVDDGTIGAASDNQYVVLNQRNRTITGSVGVTDQYTKRSSLRGSLSWKSTHFPFGANNDLESWAAHGTSVHQLTRSWAMRVGFGREQIRYPLLSQEPIVEDVVNVSADYGNEVPLSRRLSFSVSADTSVLRQGTTTTYRLNGSATVSRGFARTWSTSFGYRRATEFAAGIAGPLFWDSVSASINGLMTTRMRWSSEVSAGRGEIGSVDRRPFKAYSGSSMIIVGLTRSLGIFGQQAYYHYELPAGLTAFDLRSQLSKYRFSVGISWWLPLATETRTPIDPR